MLLVIVLIVALGAVFLGGYRLLEKVNFSLSGLEIIFFQLAFILLFHVGEYSFVRYEELSKVIGFVFLVMVIYYYILRMIKTKQYIRWQLLVVYVGILLINIYSFNYIIMEGLESLGFGILYFLFSVGTILFLLIINLVTLIMRKVKHITFKNVQLLLKKEIIISLIVLAGIFPILYAVTESEKMKYENNKILEQSKEKVLEYLNKKYGDGEFEITDASYYESDFSYEIKTSYFDNVFIVEGYNYHNSFDVYNDEFIFEYLSSKYNEEVINYYDVEEILKQEISKNFEEKYNINIDYTYFEFDELEFEKAFFNKIIDKMIYIN